VIPKRKKPLIEEFQNTSSSVKTRGVFKAGSNTEDLWLGLLPKFSKPYVKNTLKLGKVFSNMLLYVILKHYGKQTHWKNIIHGYNSWDFHLILYNINLLYFLIDKVCCMVLYSSDLHEFCTKIASEMKLSDDLNLVLLF